MDSKVYIIAEIGVNHNGNIYTAERLIQEAHKAGADAVKFQKRCLEEIYTPEILENPNNAEWNFEYLIPILKEVEFTVEQMEFLQGIAKSFGLDFIVTPFDLKSAEEMKPLVDRWKIGSMDMRNRPLVQYCIDTEKPVIISTGMWSHEEIFNATGKFMKRDVTWLLANSTYPTPYESINLGYLPTLKGILRDGHKVGYSGHERGGHIPVAAVALGAQVIEKHITMDREQTGPDHKASMLPHEFKEMVDNIRDLEKAMGEKKVVNQAERLAKQTFTRGTYAKADMKAGDAVSFLDVKFLAPGKGIAMHDFSEYSGMVLTKDVSKGECITPAHFETTPEIKDWVVPEFHKGWGVKCRFHDFEEYKQLKSPVIEFHMSQTDLDTRFMGASKDSQLVVHAPEIFDRKLIDICSKDSEHVLGSIDILQRTIDKTLEIAKRFPKARPKLVCHLGGMSLDEAKDPNLIHEMMDRAVDNFKLLEYNPSDIEILPENLPPRPWYFGGQYFQYGFMDANDMADFCDYFDLDMTLDCCHAALYCEHAKIPLTQYIEDTECFASHIHLSDAIGIDGEGVQIGEGDIDFDKLMHYLQPNKDFTWVTEIWQGHDNKGAGTYYSMHQLSKYKGIL